MRTWSLFSIVVVAAAATLGCQSGASLEPSAEPASSLTVRPSITSLDGGQTLRLTARVRQADGSITSPVDVTWRSEDGAIASVDDSGTVRGLRAGRVQIVATWHDSRGSSLVTVVDPGTKGKKPGRCLQLLEAESGSGIPTDGGCA